MFPRFDTWPLPVASLMLVPMSTGVTSQVDGLVRSRGGSARAEVVVGHTGGV